MMQDDGRGGSAVVLVVAGRVRRGAWMTASELRESGVCELCRTAVERCLVSKRGLRTWLCERCEPQCDEPLPPVTVDGEPVRTLVEARARLAKGQRTVDLRLAERYEAAIKRWTKATTPHGYRRPPAAKPNHARAVWHPFWQPTTTTKPGKQD